MFLLATYLRPQWPRAVLLAVLLLSGIALQLANPQIAKSFIDQAQAGEPFERLVWVALLFIGVVLLSQVATIAETYVAENLGWRTTNSLRADLARHVLDLDAGFHAEHTSGELIERIDGDVSAIAEFFSRFVVQVLGNALFLVGVLVLLFREDWRVGLLLTACAVAALVFMTRGGGFVTVRSRAARETAADLSAFLEERLLGLPDIKSSGADAYAMRSLNERLAARFRSTQRAVMAAGIFNGIVGLLLALGTGAALALSASLVLQGAMTLGAVYVVFRYTGMLRQPLERLTRQMAMFLRAAGAIVRVRELLSVSPRIVDGPSRTLREGPLPVTLEHVSFSYETEPVLRGVSWQLAPGEVLGVLGRTGSGKTTISRLLFRLHDANEGVVRIGGVDVRDLRLATLRERIALVTQDVQLFDGTLRDNVALFDPGVLDAQLRQAFQVLGLEEWLRALPEGFDTRLGTHGRGLSAGEAQLVALTRVFLKNPGLVVLDEASSRLDPHTEQLLEGAIGRLLAGRTGIVIAHRLATVQRVDKVVVLEDGCVAEFGARAELEQDSESRFARLLRAGMAEALA